MTDRLDTIRKRLASGNPFTPHAGDLAWAVGEIERLTGDIAEVDMVLGVVGADREFRRVMLCTNRDRMKGLVAENTRLAALERAITQRDEYLAALWLCAYETAWVRTPGEYNLVQPWPMEEGPPRLLVMCSDTFAWACADCEPCEYPRATDVLRIMQTEGWPGVVRWVQAQRQERGEMAEPIEPVAKAMAREDELRAEIDRLTTALGAAEESLVDHEHMHPSSCLVYRMPEMTHEDEVNAWRAWFNGGESDAATNARAEIARLDALSRATADDPEDVVPCVPCGRVECECGDARDEEACS